MRQAEEEAVKKEGKQGLVEERERLGVGSSPLTTCLVAGAIEGGGGLKDRTVVAFGSSSLDRVSGRESMLHSCCWHSRNPHSRRGGDRAVCGPTATAWADKRQSFVETLRRFQVDC